MILSCSQIVIVASSVPASLLTIFLLFASPLMDSHPHYRMAIEGNKDAILTVEEDRGGGGVASAEEARPRDPPLVTAKKYWNMITSKYLNILLLSMPFGLLARVLDWGPGPVFFLNFM